ncbi:Uncharacterised protein [Mycobacteroides abscessus subsp. abscessus]|nr:Uncharacterised protein [Mycobacteroides abscessus subsp. abscessus]
MPALSSLPVLKNSRSMKWQQNFSQTGQPTKKWPKPPTRTETETPLPGSEKPSVTISNRQKKDRKIIIRINGTGRGNAAGFFSCFVSGKCNVEKLNRKVGGITADLGRINKKVGRIT